MIGSRLDLLGAVAVSAIALLHLFVIPHGHALNEDYAVYLRQAEILLGLDREAGMRVIWHFDDQGLTPASAVGPEVYPWGVPALYALAYPFLGLDIDAFKAVQVVVSAAAMAAVFISARVSGFGTWPAAASCALFTVSPYFTQATHSLGSDLIFLLALPLALIVSTRAIDTSKSRPTGNSAALLAWSGVAIAFAAEVRILGLLLVPAVASIELLRMRGIPWRSVAIAAIAAISIVAFRLAVPAIGSGYSFISAYRFLDPIPNARQFWNALTKPWQGSSLELASDIIVLALIALAALGFLLRLRRASVLDAFLLIYAGAILLLPNLDAGPRYLLPVLVFLGAYAICGLEAVAGLAGTKALTHAAAAAGFATCAALFLDGSTRLPRAEARYGVTSPATRDMFAAIAKLPVGSVVSMSKYRSGALFAHRTTIRMPHLITRNEIQAWLTKRKVTHLAFKVSPSASRFDYADCPALPICGVITEAESDVVFRSADYVVIRLR